MVAGVHRGRAILQEIKMSVSLRNRTPAINIDSRKRWSKPCHVVVTFGPALYTANKARPQTVIKFWPLSRAGQHLHLQRHGEPRLVFDMIARMRSRQRWLDSRSSDIFHRRCVFVYDVFFIVAASSHETSSANLSTILFVIRKRLLFYWKNVLFVYVLSKHFNNNNRNIVNNVRMKLQLLKSSKITIFLDSTPETWAKFHLRIPPSEQNYVD